MRGDLTDADWKIIKSFFRAIAATERTQQEVIGYSQRYALGCPWQDMLECGEK